MSKELNNFQKNMFIIIIGIFVVITVFLVMKFTVGKSLTQLREENATLEQQYEELKSYVADIGTYQQGIIENEAKIQECLAKYEATTTVPTTLVKYEQLLANNGFKTSSLTYNTPEEVTNIAFTANNVPKSYSIEKTQISEVYACSYDNLIYYLDSLIKNMNNSNIASISISPDETTGELLGTITLNKYTIQGDDKVLDDIIVDVDTGKDKIW